MRRSPAVALRAMADTAAIAPYLGMDGYVLCGWVGTMPSAWQALAVEDPATAGSRPQDSCPIVRYGAGVGPSTYLSIMTVAFGSIMPCTAK